MTITPPENLAYATVVGRILKTFVDSGDPGREPDIAPASWEATFTPKVSMYKNLAMPAMFIETAYKGVSDSAGYLVDEFGNQGVLLMAPDSSDLSPSGWPYSVQIKAEGRVFPAFDMVVHGGQTIDLTLVSPANTSPGVVTVVSEQSRIAAEAAAAEAQAIADDLLAGVGPAVEEYLTANPPTGGGGGVDDTGIGLLVLDENSDTNDALMSILASYALTSHSHAISNITNLQTELNSKADAATVANALALKADAAAVNTALAGKADVSALSAKADLVGGVIPTSQMPPLAINEIFTVASQAAMLALTAQSGDMAIRTDTGRTYVLATDSPSTLADWKEVLGAGQVTSVAGKTGVVTLTASDVSAVPTTRTVAGKALTADITLTAADVSAVPTTRTVAGKALSANVSLVASDVGAVPSTAGIRPRIRATALNTWPNRATWIAANIPGYTGPVDWDSLAFANFTLVPPILADDGWWKRSA